MKRRILSIVMALALCLGLLPGMAAEGAEELGPEVEYSLDGGTSWTKFDRLVDVLFYADGYDSITNPKIRLIRDIVYDFDTPIIVADAGQHAEIDGQDHTIKRGSGCQKYMFTVNKADAHITFKNITIDGGAVWDDAEDVEGWTNSGLSMQTDAYLMCIEGDCTGSSITLEKNVVLQNNNIVSSMAGAAVCVRSGTFTMNEDCVICGNKADGFNNRGGDAGAVQVYSGAKFVMNGGEVCCNYAEVSGGAVKINSGGTFTLNGGKIYNNASGNNGGAVRTDGTMSMTGGEISDNSTDSLGGGICNLGTLNISGGKISGNAAPNGDGICAYSGTVSVSGGEINNNKSQYSAGTDIYVQATLDLSASPQIGRMRLLGDGQIWAKDDFAPQDPVKVYVNGATENAIVACLYTSNTPDASTFECINGGFYTAIYGDYYIVLKKAAIGITFNTQGGSEVDGQTLQTPGPAAEPKDPVKRGHTFGGWYKEAACETEWNFADTVDSNVTIYAGWTVNSYKITISRQNGDAPTETEADYGTKLTAPADPEREHYAFGGWYRNAACTKAWNFNTDTVEEETTLYAKWIPDSHTITFDSQDGSESATIQADYGTKLTAPADPTRSGYTFGGWYKEAACVNAWKFNTDTVTGNTTLYAKWTDNTSGSGGSGNSSGGGSGASAAPTLPVSTTGQNSSAVTTTTTAAPAADNRGGTASSTVSSAVGSEIVRQAVENKSESVVIAPEITGDVTSTEISIPASTVGEIGRKTGASLTVSTPVADVTIPNSALDSLSAAGGAVTVAAEEKDGTVELTVTAGGRTVESLAGGLTLTVPVSDAAPGTVAVLVYEDGTREVVRKSVADGESITIPLDGSAKLEIVDNSKQFSDVPAASWAADAVAFASAHELFAGTGEGQFSPDLPMSRGMLAVVLHNLESNPEQPYSGEFSDVSGGEWYAAGIAWAEENGIVNGYGNDQFGPNDAITREQLAVMLWRYAGSPAAGGELNFSDAESISAYALEAMRWAVENGIINGYGNGLLCPRNQATRAQVAQMLKNYMTMYK